MATYIEHKANTRGHADHGWLNSYQSFSFAGYYNPERINFGALRVLNDDVVAGGKGFGLHPHDNMEIISIPLKGALEHKDNMGNTRVISQGEVQVMSTGTGVFHSEYNHNADQEAQFLQIWVFPKQLNIAPRYDQIILDRTRMQNTLLPFISPESADGGTYIQQDAWFSSGIFDNGKTTSYDVHSTGNGVYAFVISGSFTVDGHLLDARDALAIENPATVNIVATSDKAELLIIEVPMKPSSN
ncbi:pirin family protein [Paraflavitalea sp. CAU 1676]|uniref:pirin family protein n=1 Tax=Paraflavitalea sp. CAU 1676 TaxID=3032598 RepID=UPI0023DAA8B0|nr:pirin family protein [Paraflavitalea sp. CAU 1676]MDF2188185.1 pirin family protein [Paraflavitalea sp. CAU 1676]